MLHSRASSAKWERRGTKIPESVQRVPEKVPELFGRVVHALLRAIFSVGCYLASRGTPRSGRGGRRFKSCHSDQYLAPSEIAAPTVSPPETRGGRAMKRTSLPLQRREFITLLGGAAVAWPLGAHAQQREKMRRIGVLLPGTADDAEFQARIGAFLQGLQELG